MTVSFLKVSTGLYTRLLPDGEHDNNKVGCVLSGEFRKVRNPKFHRKYFSLLNFAFSCWEVPQGEPSQFNPEKNFDTFRKNIIAKTGRYTASYSLDGSVRIEAKSISFASMKEDEFAVLYSDTINVILKHVLTAYSYEDVENTIAQLLEFDG